MTRAFAIAIAGIVLTTANVSAAWRMEIQSRTAYQNQISVTLNFTYAWDASIVASTLPVVVRSIDPGSFWTGSLPYDTVDSDGNRFMNGVTWNSIVPPHATVVRSVQPGKGNTEPGFGCNSEADIAQYDGISPDYFAINTTGLNALAAKPAGVVFLTITFGVSNSLGQFEFDTACFTASLNKIFMIDQNFVDHGPPPGNNDVVFTKGVATIIEAPSCYCPGFCDLNGDGVINPLDVVCIVDYIFKGLDRRQQIPTCPAASGSPNRNGDWNCDGWVNPVDMVHYVWYVYKGQTDFPPCNPCACMVYPAQAPGDCPPWP